MLFKRHRQLYLRRTVLRCSMENIKRLSGVAMLAMAALSFTNLFGLPIAGLTVLIGVACFFIDKGKTPFAQSGFDCKGIGKAFSDKTIWLWMALPLLMDGIAVILSKLVLPEFIAHVASRTAVLVSFDRVALMLIQLIVFAVGEEIAWRAFFQNQAQRMMPAPLAVLVTSVLFGIGHIADGNAVVIVYDVFFVGVNSCLYGIVFYKTKNAWMSAIAHFAANLFSVMILQF